MTDIVTRAAEGDLGEWFVNSWAAQGAHTKVIDYLDAYENAVSREHIRSAAEEAGRALLTFALMKEEK